MLGPRNGDIHTFRSISCKQLKLGDAKETVRNLACTRYPLSPSLQVAIRMLVCLFTAIIIFQPVVCSCKGSMPVPSTAGLRGAQRSIIHLDMDCFFASVAALEDPCLQGKPLAVCHSNSAQGTAEISSCNYLARAYGIRAVMCVGEAKRLCPSLIIMPYQYDKYEIVSEQVPFQPPSAPVDVSGV